MATMSYDDKRVSGHVRAGFSLMEIMIAVMILGLVAALVGPKVFQMLDNAKKTSAASEIKTIKGQIALYKTNMGSYPQKLKDLVDMPKNDERAKKKWQGPYLDKLPEDPWGAKYHYKVNAEGAKKPYELLSYGPEGKGHKDGYIDVWSED
jgi:general secretion pathway protein G